MEIKTMYEIGERVWVIYEYKSEVNVYSDIIESYSISEEGVNVWLKDSDTMEIKEEDLVLYDDLELLAEKIKELDTKIRKENGEDIEEKEEMTLSLENYSPEDKPFGDTTIFYGKFDNE